MKNDQYSKHYSEDSLFKKIKSVFSKAGVSVIYGVLLLFYALKDPAVPMGAKATIVAALGYFIAPIDLIIDATPGIGYGDDLGAIMTALGVIAVYIGPETKRKAKEKTLEWFGDATEEDFSTIDSKIS